MLRFLCISAALGAARGAQQKPQTRIVGGAPVAGTSVPFYAFVKVSNAGGTYSECGGTIIAPGAVLTSAHCFKDMGNGGTVFLGLSSKAVAGQTLPFDRAAVSVHPMWSSGGTKYDVAVVRLSAPSKYAPMPISRTPSPVGGAAFITGYGYTKALAAGAAATADGFPTALQVASVNIVSPNLCAQSWGDSFNATQHICVGNWVGGVDSCVGDSGGPLTLTSGGLNAASVAGIVSFGSGCGVYGTYSVYTRPGAFFDWVQSKIGTTLPKTSAVAALDPAASSSVCSYVNYTAATANTNFVLSCGANPIASVSPGSYVTGPACTAAETKLTTCATQIAGVNLASCVGSTFCQMPAARCKGAAFVARAVCGSAVKQLAA